MKYNQLNIPVEVLKDMVLFLIENTEISFEESFYDQLSLDNKGYIDKYYRPEKLKLNLETNDELIPHIREKEDLSNKEYAIY